MTNAKNVKTTELATLIIAIADPEQEVSAITKMADFNIIKDINCPRPIRISFLA